MENVTQPYAIPDTAVDTHISKIVIRYIISSWSLVQPPSRDPLRLTQSIADLNIIEGICAERVRCFVGKNAKIAGKFAQVQQESSKIISYLPSWTRFPAGARLLAAPTTIQPSIGLFLLKFYQSLIWYVFGDFMIHTYIAFIFLYLMKSLLQSLLFEIGLEVDQHTKFLPENT
ncbi:hypothetical protein Trydic_g16253 [Trypoxylus dichotomus]